METVDSRRKVLQECVQRGNILTPHKALFFAIRTIFSESGFCSQNQDEEFASEQNYYQLDLRHCSCEDVVCKLLYVPIDRNLAIIYGFVKEEQVRTLEISCNAFVSLRSESLHPDEMYKDFDVLSQTIKDGILTPMLISVLQSVGIIPKSSLMTLAAELKLHILCYLSVTDLLAVSLINHEFHTLSQTHDLWELLFKKDFKDSEEQSTSDKTWKELYKEKYIQRRTRQEIMRNSTLVIPRPLLDPMMQIPEPGPPFAPGIIGGERDRFPDFNMHPHPDIAAAFPGLIRRQHFSSPGRFDSHGWSSSFRF